MRKVGAVLVVVFICVFASSVWSKPKVDKNHHYVNVTQETSADAVSTSESSSAVSVRDHPDAYQGVTWVPSEFPYRSSEVPFFWNKALDSGEAKRHWAFEEVRCALKPPQLIDLGILKLGPLQWGRGFNSDTITWSTKKPTKVVQVYSSSSGINVSDYTKIGVVGVVAKTDCLEDRVRVEAIRLAMTLGAEIVVYRSDVNTEVVAESGGIAGLPVFGLSAPGSVSGVLGLSGGRTKKSGRPGIIADLYVK